MVAGHVSKDSWSRSETPSMLYDTVRNPNAPYQPPRAAVTPVGKSKDTIESIQQRLQREMTGRLHSKGLSLPHETYVAVVQVGKYVFLAVMLPVYLCCYGVPRWFLVNAVPQLFGTIKNQSLNIGRFFIEIAKRAADLMKGILDQVLGDALRLSMDMAKNLMKNLSSKFKRFSNTLTRIKKSGKSFLRKIKDKMALDLFGFRKKNSHKIRTAKEGLFHNASAFGKQVGASFSRRLKAADRVVFTPFVRTFIRIVNMVKSDVDRTIKTMNKWIKKVTNPLISSISEAIRKKAENYKDKLKKEMEPVLHLLTDVKEIGEWCLKKIQKTVIHPVVHSIAAARTHIEPYVAAGWGVAKKVLSVVPAGLRRSLLFAIKAVPRPLRKRMEDPEHSFTRFRRSLKAISQGVSSGFKELVVLCIKLTATAKGLLVKCIENLFRFIQWLFWQLITLPRKMLRWFMIFFKALSFVVVRVIFTAQVVLVLMWIACIYSFRLARELSRPFLGAEQAR